VKKILYVFGIVCLFQISSQAMSEISIYTAKKYNTNYSKLNQEQQQEILKEYEKVKKLSTKIYDDIKSTNYYEVNKNLLSIEIWSKKYLNNYIPSQTELQDIYKKNIFKTNPKYKLKTLTLTDKKRAQSIIKQLNNKKTKQKRIKLFEIFVKKDSLDTTTKNKKGNLDWISEEKLLPNIRKNISNLKVNDIMTLRIKDNIQILYLDNKQEPKKATFEESKATLIQIAKKQALNKKIEELLN